MPIVRLFQDTVHLSTTPDYTPVQQDAWAPVAIDPAQWCAPLANDDTLVAVVNDEIVGFANMTATGYLDRLYVHFAHQREGIATQLVGQLEDDARRAGVRTVTVAASLTAEPFFHHQGYHVLHRNTVLRHGVALRNATMAKVLGTQRCPDRKDR
ncbi:putative acetyltransferase [Schleiferilactobacillus shenzhenensis LY-73]|uniref:Putative acetyltransferase n=1 Tax=Schleiferilactobacillus shenzhenensis LY-73 TaxID=1231336 RepID=U4TR68_9LACO|nr:putative acetyltransferase [Schleiferilactobacillus shenzhenensis LY-73]